MWIGDYVLYAVHKPDTKLGYVWKGLDVVLSQISPLVYEVKPAVIPHSATIGSRLQGTQVRREDLTLLRKYSQTWPETTSIM